MANLIIYIISNIDFLVTLGYSFSFYTYIKYVTSNIETIVLLYKS